MAAFGRVLRTLGGRNIGKCRLRAHQHPLSPPLSNLLEPARAHPMQNVQGKTRTSARDERVLGDVWGCVLKIGCFVHRFLISSPDLRIDACFFPFTSSFVHRFLISSPNLRIDARFRMQNSYYQRCPRPIPIFVAQRRMARLQRLWRQQLPHPILIFAAAKKNGPPAAGLATKIFRVQI